MVEARRSPAEGYRDELRLFCYRMLGSLQEAEGLVEAVIFKADGLPLPHTEMDSMRTELFKLAARMCLEPLAEQPPRSLPALEGPPSDPSLPPPPPREGGLWLEPFPDDLFRETGHGGTTRYTEREGISLAMIGALQSLYVRERLCLVLGDIMGWEAERLAEVLGAGAADTEGVVKEARETMSRAYDEGMGKREPPPEDITTELMMRYLYPWETGDVGALVERLSEDAVLQLPPSPSWYQGGESVRQYLVSNPLQGEARGRWRLLPRRANGQLAFGVYRRDDERGVYSAHSIQVVHFAGELVSEIVAFEYPWLFPPFKLLPEVAVQG